MLKKYFFTQQLVDKYKPTIMSITCNFTSKTELKKLAEESRDQNYKTSEYYDNTGKYNVHTLQFEPKTKTALTNPLLNHLINTTSKYRTVKFDATYPSNKCLISLYFEIEMDKYRYFDFYDYYPLDFHEFNQKAKATLTQYRKNLSRVHRAQKE